jgi:hypothetical protein
MSTSTTVPTVRQIPADRYHGNGCHRDDLAVADSETHSVEVALWEWDADGRQRLTTSVHIPEVLPGGDDIGACTVGSRDRVAAWVGFDVTLILTKDHARQLVEALQEVLNEE